MKINTNYLNIFKEKSNNNLLLKTIIVKAFQNIRLSKRQKIWGIICFFFLGVAFIMKASEPQIGKALGANFYTEDKIKTVGEVLDEKVFIGALAKYVEFRASMVQGFSFLGVVKTFLEYISDIQTASIGVVEDTPFGKRGMFDSIYFGLTIFAVIGCLYKVIIHFLNTERHDNVKAYTGYFQYLSIAILFVFSDKIVDRVVGLNEGIKHEKLKEMASSFSTELDNALVNDLTKVVKDIEKIEKNIENTRHDIDKEWGPSISKRLDILKDSMSIWKLEVFDGYLAIWGKYVYYSITIMLITSIMAVPAFILSIMVKILLSVMVAGTKLVFLLAFIPGFENTWKTFMLNMLNILLWTPIFNAIYGFIIALVVGLMTNNTLGSGQIVWLTIISIILAFQSLSLTTSAAGVVINGAGASIAGAMGSIATMNGVNAGLGVAKAAVSGATLGVKGIIANKTMNSLGNISNSLSNIEKHMKK